jgi:putative phosphoesterase
MALKPRETVTRIGVISDTHDFLDPRVKEIFEGVHHIIHAGDIGLPWLILQLEEIAPVTAVLGNTDETGLDYNETELVQLGERKFLVHHEIDPHNVGEKIKRRIIRENPDVVVFGHSHKPFFENIGNTLFLNPGYAGNKRFNLPRTVAILNCDEQGITADFIDLEEEVFVPDEPAQVPA